MKTIRALNINFMLESFGHKLRLADIASEIGLSVSHYSRLFQARTGHSPIDYCIQLKVHRACRLLDNSGWLIAEVSCGAGFEDQFYFSRVFQKVIGMSAVKYQKERLNSYSSSSSQYRHCGGAFPLFLKIPSLF